MEWCPSCWRPHRDCRCLLVHVEMLWKCRLLWRNIVWRWPGSKGFSRFRILVCLRKCHRNHWFFQWFLWPLFGLWLRCPCRRNHRVYDVVPCCCGTLLMPTSLKTPCFFIGSASLFIPCFVCSCPTLLYPDLWFQQHLLVFNLVVVFVWCCCNLLAFLCCNCGCVYP